MYGKKTAGWMLILSMLWVWHGHALAYTQTLVSPPDTPPQVTLPAVHPLKVLRQAAVVFQMAALEGGTADQVVLDLFGDTVLTAVHTHTEIIGLQGYVWYGWLSNIPDSQVCLVAGQDRLSGVIRTPSRTYKIRPLTENLHVVREIDTASDTIYQDNSAALQTTGLALQSTNDSPVVDEYDVWNLVNDERREAGLHALTWNHQLFNAAREHSLDMAVENYFSHTGLDGRSAGDRIFDAGYDWQTYGENIAYGYVTPDAVMAGWMNSAGHRANILNGSFCELGVGIAEHANSGHQLYWTQDFGKQKGAGDCTATPANQAPVAQFVASPLSGEAPLQVDLDASGAYDPDGHMAGYQWDFGDGTSGNGVQVQHDYTAAGSYTVKLTVVDDNGAVNAHTAAGLITVGSPGGGGSGCFIGIAADFCSDQLFHEQTAMAAGLGLWANSDPIPPWKFRRK